MIFSAKSASTWKVHVNDDDDDDDDDDDEEDEELARQILTSQFGPIH